MAGDPSEPQTLPVHAFAKQIVDAVRGSPVSVVIGETGSGKTTQISQVILTEGTQRSCQSDRIWRILGLRC